MISKIKKYLTSIWQNKAQDASITDVVDQDLQLTSTTDNKQIISKQQQLLLLILISCVVGVLILIRLLQDNSKQPVIVNKDPKLKIEVAGESLDPEKMWRNHFEDKLFSSKRDFNERFSQMEETFVEEKRKLEASTKELVTKLQEQVKYAQQELVSASRELKRVHDLEEEKLYNTQSLAKSLNITATDLDGHIEFDQPKSSRDYIPETSYVSGYLLGGLAVSTALSTPDENAAPVVIRLTSRGNLPKNFTTDIKQCRILGSSYGDISSERAIVRLEKMVCIDPVTELVTTSKVAGTVFGPDGMNGIKGSVVATSSKHIKNALVGGIISGLSNSAKGAESMTISSLGAISTKKKGVKQVAGEGLLAGTSNAAEKVADYYLRMAESMSPILVIPGGVKVDVMFIKGFFVGEIDTHKKIKLARKVNKAQSNEAWGKEDE